MKSDLIHSITSQDSFKINIDKQVKIENYFNYMDSLVDKLQDSVNYPISEHIIVRSNPWIIDTLKNTDYYHMLKRDSFVFNQRKLAVLFPENSITIPDSTQANKIIQAFNDTYLDINIPEFKLRIYEGSKLLYTFPIRVGQNNKKYLVMSKVITDLRTRSGIGTIIRHERHPKFYNPVTGERFSLTKRDDNRITRMPQIPWIETEINGIRNGQMIHPTTNPVTLEKPYSNGCIGLRESDAWIVYYYAPVNTKIMIRYELNILNSNGDSVRLKDIYKTTN